MDIQALSLSLRLALTSTLILGAVGLPLTYWMSRRPHPIWTALESLFTLPMVMPPTVLGFYLLLILGPWKLAFSFTGLLIASVISGMPLAWPAFLAAFRAVDQAYLENSQALGEASFFTFLRVALPLAKEGVWAGAILAFAHALGEFGVVLMIGGNIPGVSRTLSVALYDQVSAFDYAAANRSAFVLLTMSVIAMFSVTWLRRRRGVLV